MVLRDASILLIPGIAIGAAVSLAFASVLNTMLYGTVARDPLVLAAACSLMAMIGLLAAWLPALRAARIQPMQALRVE